MLRWLEREAPPLTRGWTQVRDLELPRESGFPARAGIDPRPTCCAGSSARLPRSRGDGPKLQTNLGTGAGSAFETKKHYR